MVPSGGYSAYRKKNIIQAVSQALHLMPGEVLQVLHQAATAKSAQDAVKSESTSSRSASSSPENRGKFKAGIQKRQQNIYSQL